MSPPWETFPPYETGLYGAALMVSENALESVPAEFAAWAVNEQVCAVVGVPTIDAVESESPAHRLPLVMDHVMGAVPVATSVFEYKRPTHPPGSGLDVVMVGAIDPPPPPPVSVRAAGH